MSNNSHKNSKGSESTNMKSVVMMSFILIFLIGVFTVGCIALDHLTKIEKTLASMKEETEETGEVAGSADTQSADISSEEEITRPNYSGYFAEELSEFGIVPVETMNGDEFQSAYGMPGQSFSTYIGSFGTVDSIPQIKARDSEYSYSTDLSELFPEAQIESGDNYFSATKEDGSGNYVYYLQNYNGFDNPEDGTRSVYLYCNDRSGAEEVNASIDGLSYQSGLADVLSKYGTPTKVDIYNVEEAESVVLDYMSDAFDVVIIISKDDIGEYISEISVSEKAPTDTVSEEEISQ